MSHFVIHLKDIFLYHVQNTGCNTLQMIVCYVNKSHSVYIRPLKISDSDEFPERQPGKLIMSIKVDYIINLLFTLLQIVANDKIITHIVIMILIKADLMGKMHMKWSTRRFYHQISAVTGLYP